MKKIIFIITLSLSAVFFACGDDDDSTTLRWDNESGVNFSGINWNGDKGEFVTWNNDTGDRQTTGKKEISDLVGTGDAVDADGIDYVLDLDEGPGVVFTQGNIAKIEKNADATLIIGNAKKK
ncbi:MAG: hypothetical protein FWH53_06535 [Leptospirales bacterium]|nr:hypothetical protein [Leptospirales bacterium]